MRILICAAILTVSCSTTTTFKLPEGSELFVDDKLVDVAPGTPWKTRAFSWRRSDGVHYKILQNSEVVEEGLLPTTFRARSIFFPPFSFLFVPMGFRGQYYDLTKPGGRTVYGNKYAPGDSKKTDTSKGLLKKAKTCQEKGGVWVNDRCEINLEEDAGN